MESVFLKLVNMSITASYLILVVIIFRLVLKKAPKSLRCILWGLVALRLIFPFSIESVLSLIPSAEPLPEEFLYAAQPKVNTGIPLFNNAINPVISESLAPGALASTNPTQIWSFVLSRIWVIGMVIMEIHAAASYLRLRSRAAAFVPVGKNIRLCDHISSPFILGIIHPKIYLPAEISQNTADHVLAHEMAHLARKDHWWKPLGYLLLTVYWFNPIIWVAYILLCRDIELACDERVIKALDLEEKKAYSSALLRCSIPRHMIAACPLAFGEVGVKSRIKSVLNYKKPTFWMIVVAVLASVLVGVCFLTDPAGRSITQLHSPTMEGLKAICVGNGNDSYLITEQKQLAQAVDALKEIRISRNETSMSRSEDRDKTNSITLRYENTDIAYYFNADCTEIWIADGMKPSLTYEVMNPEQTDWFFADTIEAPVYTEYFEIDSLLGQHIALSYRPEKGDGQITLSGDALTVTDGEGNLLFNGSDPTVTSSTWSSVSEHLTENEQLALFGSVITEENDGDALIDILEYSENGESRYTIYCMQGSPSMIYDGHRLYALRQVSAEAKTGSDRLAVGTYVPVECLYMNPASSYYPGNLSEDYIYTVTEEGFYTDSFAFICNTNVDKVDWSWKTVAEAGEDLKFLADWLDTDWAQVSQATLTLSEDALYQKLDTSNHLLLQDGNLLIIHGSAARNDVEMVWGIYKLIPEDDVRKAGTVAGKDIITNIDISDYTTDGGHIVTSLDLSDFTIEQDGTFLYLREDTGTVYDTRTTLDRVIKTEVLKMHGSDNSGETFFGESHEILLETVACGEYTGEGVGPCGSISVHIIAHIAEYHSTDDGIKTVSELTTPVVLSFDEYTDGSYRMTHYWEPQYSSGDPEEMIPEPVEEDFRNYMEFASALSELCSEQAQLYFK